MKEELLERITFTNLEILKAEKAILSSYIYHYDEVINFSELESIPELFFQNKISKIIFKTLKGLEVSHGQFDLILIYEAIKKDSELSESILEQCSKFLEELPRGAHYFNFRKYLEILRNNWVKNELNSLSKEIIETRWHLDNINDLLAKWEKNFLEITFKDRKLDYLRAGDAIKAYDLLIENSQLEERQDYLRTGFGALDSKIRGFKPGQFIVIASRPGIGKTTFALNLICNNLSKILSGEVSLEGEKERAIGIFSLEMITEIIIEKLIAIESKTELFILQRLSEGKKIDAQYFDVIESSKKKISAANLLFCDDVNITLGKIIATIKFWARKYSLKLVVIDYLQLINLPLERELNNLNSNQKISLISRQLKILSIELNICILSLSQLNRKLEERKGADRIPVLSDLRDSGSIEQDADIVIFLFPTMEKKVITHLEDEEEEGEFSDRENYARGVSLKIGKNRYGPTGIIKFILEKSLGKFSVLK